MPTSELPGYFTAEKHGAVLIAILGVVGTVLAAYLWLTKSSFRAMAWPLVIIGIGQLAIGTGARSRTRDGSSSSQGAAELTRAESRLRKIHEIAIPRR
jgi:hypothetical protein